MFSRIGIIFTFILISLLPGQLRAENHPQVLDSLINLALENNPDLEAVRLKYRAADYSARAAGTLPDPQISVAALNLPKSSLSFDETPMSGVVIGISQSVPWPSTLSARSGIAHLQADIVDRQIADLRNRLIRMLTVAYYEYSYWTRAIQIVQQNLTLSESMVQSAETRYANGLGSAQDLLRGQTTQSRLENRLLNMQFKRQAAINQINRLLDNDNRIDSTLTAVILENLNEAEPADSSVLFENNPRQEIASLQIGLSRRKQDLAKADYWPQLMLGMDYRLRKEVPGDPVGGEDFLSFKVGFSLPLWFFSRQKNRSHAARYEFMAADQNRLAVEQDLHQKYADITAFLQSSEESLNQYDENILPQAQAAFEAAQVAYEVGKVDFNALLSAHLELLDIELERMDLLKQYHQKYAELEELLGTNKGSEQ